MINVDKLRITQAIHILLSNALKFTPRGGIVTVSIYHVINNDQNIAVLPAVRNHGCYHHRRETHQSIRIDVKDTGVGIASVSIV